jgi:hypothetical protein
MIRGAFFRVNWAGGNNELCISFLGIPFEILQIFSVTIYIRIAHISFN